MSGQAVFWVVMDDTRLRRALARDVDAAFPLLLTAHQDRIYTIALRILADRADAEEATQDTFVRAHRALVDYPPERIEGLSLRPWLATIVLNACRNRRRRASDRRPPVRLGPLLEAGFDPGDPAPSIESIGEWRGEVEAWEGRLGTLSRNQRTAIVLHHVDGLSYPEIAGVLGQPEGTVKANVHRGLRRLREQLEAEGAQRREEMTA